MVAQKKKYLQKLKTFLVLCLCVYFVVLIGAFFSQRHFIYVPNGAYITPAEAGQGDTYQELPARTDDGYHLKGWYAPATTKNKTIIFFHGNADNIQRTFPIAEIYRRAGYGFLLAEYRGYSGFDGSPSETGLYRDARAFLKALEDKGIPQKNIVLFGHSLGTGVATQMAVEFPKISALMLLSPFSSMGDLAQARFPFFPACYMVWDEYANEDKIPNIKMPILIVHGTWDKIVPISQGKTLFELADKPKEFHAIPHGGHNDLFHIPFAAISLSWLDRVVK